MDITLEVGASTPDFIKGLRDARNELAGIRDENVKLNQDLKAKMGENAGAGEKLTQTFVGTAKQLAVTKQVAKEVTDALAQQGAAGKAAGDATAKGAAAAITAIEQQKKNLQALKEALANLQSKGVTGAPVTNTQKAIDTGQAALAKLEADALDQDSDSLDKNKEKTLSLKQQKRQLTEAIALLLVEGKQESQQFQELTAKAGQLDDAIRDANAAIKLTGSDTRGIDTAVQVVGGLAGGFSAAQGAIALFDKDNQALQETLLRVNAAMSIANGIQQVGNVLTNEKIKTDVIRYANQVKQNIQTAISNGLESESVVVRTASAAAQRVLNIVMAENPMFAIATVLATLVGLFVTYKLTIGAVSVAEQTRKDTLEAMRKVQADAARATIEQTVALKAQLGILDDGTASIEQKNEAYKKIREQYPEYLGFLNREAVSTKEGSDAIEKQIALIAKKQLVISAEKALTDALEAQSKAQADLSAEQNIFQKAADAFGALDITAKYGAITDAQKKVAIATNVFKNAQLDLNGASHRTTEELKAQIVIYQALANAIPGYTASAVAAISQLNKAIDANATQDRNKALNDQKKALDIQLAYARDNSKSQFDIKKQQVANDAALAKADAEKTIVDQKELQNTKDVIDAQALKAAKDLNKEYAAVVKERLQSQVDANNKLKEAQSALTEAQIAIQKEGIQKERDAIKLSYDQKVAGIEQSIKAEEIRIKGNEKVSAAERSAVISANEVRQKTVVQLRLNENKEITDLENKFARDQLALRLQSEQDIVNLQADSLQKSIKLIELENEAKIATYKQTYKKFPLAIAVFEIQAEKEKNEKVKAAKQQFAIDELQRQEENATKSIDQIQFTADSEGRITKLKETLKIKIEADAARERLKVIKANADKENQLQIESITKQFSDANIIAASKKGIDVFEFLGIKLEGTPESIAKAKEVILESVEKIKNEVKNNKTNSKIDIFKEVFNIDQGSFDANLAMFDNYVDKVRETISTLLTAYNSFLQQRADQQQKEVDLDNERLDKAQQNLDDELAFQKKGYANNVKAKQEEVDKIKKQRDDDTAHLKEIQKQQAKVGIAMQATALAVSVAKMIEAIAAIINSGAESGGYVGAIAAVVAAAGVVAGFVSLSNSVKAYKSLRKGGDLDLMDSLDGQPSHDHGGVDVVNKRTGQKIAELEGNEKLFVVNKGGTAQKYYSMLKAINDGSIESWGISQYGKLQPHLIEPSDIQMKDNVLPMLIGLGDQDAGKNVRVSSGHVVTDGAKHLHRIAVSNEALLDLERNKETYYQDGEDLIIVKGNSTRRIKKTVTNE